MKFPSCVGLALGDMIVASHTSRPTQPSLIQGIRGLGTGIEEGERGQETRKFIQRILATSLKCSADNGVLRLRINICLGPKSWRLYSRICSSKVCLGPSLSHPSFRKISHLRAGERRGLDCPPFIGKEPGAQTELDCPKIALI